MARGYKTKVKGGMSKTWISDIRKNHLTSEAVAQDVERVISKANASMKVRYPTSGFSWFYKSVRLKGKWGTTFIINATTPMSKKRTEVLESTLKSLGINRK